VALAHEHNWEQPPPAYVSALSGEQDVCQGFQAIRPVYTPELERKIWSKKVFHTMVKCGVPRERFGTAKNIVNVVRG
jgi:hypothetical protein